jgi:hypothetical protein
MVTGVMTSDLVIRLQLAESKPSISVLLSTTPNPELASRAVVRLDRMVVSAERRLRADVFTGETATILE